MQAVRHSSVEGLGILGFLHFWACRLLGFLVLGRLLLRLFGFQAVRLLDFRVLGSRVEG